MEAFIKKEPSAAAYFYPWYGAKEFISQKPRYCLWLGECSPAQLKQMPYCLERVRAVKEYRESSTRASTVKMAMKPTRFQTENMPKGNYIVIPEVSSEKEGIFLLDFSRQKFCAVIWSKLYLIRHCIILVCLLPMYIWHGCVRFADV